jgi:hypothetical protein
MKISLPKKDRFQRCLFGIIALLVTTLVVVSRLSALGSPLYPTALVYYKNASTGKQPGDATTPNTFARAYAYRSNISNQLSVTDSPPAGQIYAAASGDPAYTGWDVGSSQWTNVQSGDQSLLVTETTKGQNGWTGDSWVGGAKVNVTQAMLNNLEIDYHVIVMEPIPTPTLVSNTTSSITIGWSGLYDNDTGASGGAGPTSVIGYSIYRSVDGGAYSLLSSVAQSAGANINYIDASVTQGHTYTYKLGVRFEWTAHTPAYYEPAAQGPDSASLSAGLPQPVSLKFLNSAVSAAAGAKSGPYTIQTSDSSGNSVNATSTTTINLTSSSTGSAAKFYAVSAGTCSTTQITSLTITSGSATAQFCYYDEMAGAWTLTAHTTSLVDATQVSTVTSASTLGSIGWNGTSSQKNRIAFTGTNTLTAYDAYHNIMTGFSPVTDPVTFTLTPSTAVIGGLDGTGSSQLTQASDFTNGVANLAGKISLTGQAGTYTLTATTSSGKTTSGSIDLKAGALQHFDSSLTSPQTIDTAFTGTNTITALDADNNVITDFNAATTNVTLSESGSVGSVSGLGSGSNAVLNQSTNFVSGVASVTGMKYVGPSSSHTFKITSGAVNSTTGAVTFNPGSLSKFAIALSTPQVNAQAFTTATITAQDVYGNTITNFDAGANAVTLSTSGTGTLNTTSLNTTGSFSNSVATISGLTFTGLVGSHTLTATSANGKTGSATFNVTPGAPVSVKIVNGSTASATQVTTSTLTADQSLSLWAAGYDISGNWTGLLLGDWSNSGTLAPAVAITSVSSLVFNPTIAPTSGKIAFTNGSLSATTDTITVSVGTAQHFVVTAPTSATAGQSFAVTITAEDSDGNIVTSYTGAKTLAYSGPGSSTSGTAPTYQASVTFSNGVATAIPVTLVKSETVKLTATQGSISGISGDIIVGAAASNSFSVNIPTSTTAGTAITASLTAYDAFGNVDTNYSGSHSLTFENPANSPNGTTPIYPADVTFSAGLATASITLFKRESTTIKASEGTKVGTSNQIAIAAAQAKKETELDGNHQSGPVSQVLAKPLRVQVFDSYGNQKNNFSIGFNVKTGSGQVGSNSVTTDTNGVAQTTWTLGSAPGTDNNTVEAGAVGIDGSPITFVASANGNGFVITIPNGITAGTAFSPTVLKVVDVNGQTVTSYNGTKTLVFTGPSNGPNGDAPSYPVSVTFVNGVAQPLPTITLVASETTSLTVTDGSLTGTSTEFTTHVGQAAKLTITTPVQELSLNQVSSEITTCLQDQFGNAVISDHDFALDLSATSPGGVFSTSATGPWDSYHATLATGLSCMNVFYKDSYAGARTLTISSNGLVPANQPISIKPGTGDTTGNTGGGSTTTNNSTTTIVNNTSSTKTVYVYITNPTENTATPSDTTAQPVTVPSLNFPVITSPSQNAFVTSSAGTITFSGTAPTTTSLLIRSGDGRTLAATTSDSEGHWSVSVADNDFIGSVQTVYAELPTGNIQSARLTFTHKQKTFIESIISWFER